MSPAGLALSLLLIAVVIAWIALPLFRPSAKAHDTLINRQRERLLLYYDRVMTNIRDLDEERATDKISHHDHTTEREIWVTRGVQILQALDTLEAEATPVTEDHTLNDEELDHAIEALIKKMAQSS